MEPFVEVECCGSCISGDDDPGVGWFVFDLQWLLAVLSEWRRLLRLPDHLWRPVRLFLLLLELLGTGCYTGKACGTVCNKKCCGPLTYKCKNFFCDPCWCVHVSSSCYTVGKLGCCTYTASGTAKHL